MSNLDFAMLEKSFYIRLQEPENAVYSVNAVDLLDADNMRIFIERYVPLMKALDDTAAAAYLGGWLGYIALTLQYTVSLHHTAPDFSLSNLSVHVIPRDGYTYIAIQVHQWAEVKAPASEAERTEWLQEAYRRLYGATLRPLFEQISATTGLHVGQLWGQLPTKFNYYISVITQELEVEADKQRLADDYLYLKRDLNPAVFGRSKNPFDVKIRMIEHISEPDKQMRMKNVCCRYYQTEGGNYCYTCPRLNEDERAEKRAAYREKMSAVNSL